LALVVNSGSYTHKIGWSGEQEPMKEERTATAHYQSAKSAPLFGWYAQHRTKYTSLHYPMDGLVVDWDEMFCYWQGMLNLEEIQNQSSSRLLLTQPHDVTTPQLQKTAEFFFESDESPFSTLCMPCEALLPLYSLNRFTGITVDCGYSHTTVTPVINGNIASGSIQTSELGGRRITELYLDELLKRTPYSFCRQSKVSMSRYEGMKQRMCYVAFDPAAESLKSEKELEREYQLPDWQRIWAHHERYRCTEAYFGDTYGVHKQIQSSIDHLDFAMRLELLSNIVVCGGGSQLEGFTLRLQKEVASMEPKAKITAERHAAWKGASLCAQDPGTEWITKERYNECGPSIFSPNSKAKSARK